MDLDISQDDFATSVFVRFFFEDYAYVAGYANSFSALGGSIHLWGNNTTDLRVVDGYAVAGQTVGGGQWTRDRLGIDLRLIAVPEPASMVLMGAGAAVIAIRRRRKRVA